LLEKNFAGPDALSVTLSNKVYFYINVAS